MTKRMASVIAPALALTAALAMTPAATQAQDYPNQDIHFICAFPPGSGADVLVRYFAEKVRPLTGRNVIVENRSGAGGNIAQEFVGRSKPDGLTIFVHAGSAIAANRWMFKAPVFTDIGKTFQIAATINRQPFMMVVDTKSPYKSVAEVTAAMKTKGDKATYGSAAPTGTVMGELYKVATGTKAVEVSYKTAPDGLNDMASGAVDYGMHDPVFSLAQQREGRLRILAHSSGKRLQAIPDIPTMDEAGVKGMDLTSWWAYIAPAETPKPVISQLNAYLKQILETEDAKKFLNQFGGDPFVSTPEQGQALLIKDEKDWKEYVKLAKIEPQ